MSLCQSLGDSTECSNFNWYQPHFHNPFVPQNHKEFCTSHFLREILGFVYSICSYGRIKTSWTIPSGSSSLVYSYNLLALIYSICLLLLLVVVLSQVFHASFSEWFFTGVYVTVRFRFFFKTSMKYVAILNSVVVLDRLDYSYFLFLQAFSQSFGIVQKAPTTTGITISIEFL